MHPFILNIGWLRVPTYGMFAVLAFLTAILLVRRYARIEGRDPSQITDAVVRAVVVALVGARVFELAINWQTYFGPPGGLKLILLSTGVFVGAIVTAIPFGLFWFHRIKLPVLLGLDLFALVFVVADGVGRWGCFFSGCCWGTPTQLPWAVTFPEIARRLHHALPDVPIHPTQIYLSLNAFAILGVLLLVYRRKRFHGQVICTYIGLYSLTRFLLEYLRGDAERGFVFDGLLSTSQFVCLLLAAGAVAAYVVLDRQHRRTGEPDWRPAPTTELRGATDGGNRKSAGRRR
jgi:phosphatidylglycerol:prolipoprotein diacylglycerol transferase